ARALELEAHGSGEIGAAERARVFDVAASVAMATKHYDDALAMQQRGVAVLRDARTPWEQRLRAVQQCAVGLFESLMGRGEAGQAAATAGVAQAEHLTGRASLATGSALGYLAQIQARNGDWIGSRDSLTRVIAINRAHPWLDAKYSDRALNGLAF